MKRISLEPVTFLIVDDREENLTALEALLRRDGLRILKARTGDEALEVLLTHDIALALLDVQMPDMDGFALAELMRGSERTRHVPIIFVTAALQEQHRVFRGYDAGAVDFLFKPIEPRILRHKVGVFFDLYQQRQILADTLRVNEMFVAAIGHDLRSPIQSIVMATELMMKDQPDPLMGQLGERIRRSSRRMVRMIDDLFDLARARLGDGIPLEKTLTDLATVAQSVVTEVQGGVQGGANGRTIVVRREGNTIGSWDSGRVEQIASNLIGNAIRHGQPGTPIDVFVGGHGDEVSLSVHNAGVIPSEVRDTLFDPFRSGGHSVRVRREGLGLGLFIVDQLVRAHGGAIEVESTEALGTTFRVRLPTGSRERVGHSAAPEGFGEPPFGVPHRD